MIKWRSILALSLFLGLVVYYTVEIIVISVVLQTPPAVSPLPTTTAAPTTYKHWDWKTNCGVQPLDHRGQIVNGSFGVWPWQVLVKESKYLGKGEWKSQNKC